MYLGRSNFKGGAIEGWMKTDEGVVCPFVSEHPQRRPKDKLYNGHKKTVITHILGDCSLFLRLNKKEDQHELCQQQVS